MSDWSPPHWACRCTDPSCVFTSMVARAAGYVMAISLSFDFWSFDWDKQLDCVNNGFSEFALLRHSRSSEINVGKATCVCAFVFSASIWLCCVVMDSVFILNILTVLFVFLSLLPSRFRAHYTVISALHHHGRRRARRAPHAHRERHAGRRRRVPVPGGPQRTFQAHPGRCSAHRPQ